MKKDIHPDYHPITVVMTDGTRYETRSTWGKAGDVLQLDVDPKTHPAWVGGVNLRKTGQLEKFENKFKAFSGLSTATQKAAGSASAAKPGAKKEAKAEKTPKKDADADQA
ncbi:MAG: 50S ribosomal protein L31 [Alphaproteobacteria bacterium]|nr:50S ribosomal protein L31 [Alphaproteobacteria bacterium]